MRIPLKIPAGMVKPGTRLEARGRWYEGNLVRWHEGVLRPVGGWDSFRDLASTAPQGAHAWIINTDRRPRLAVGTATELHLISDSGAEDITPADLVAGDEDSSYGTGSYGEGLFGVGLYGEGDLSSTFLNEANIWSLDNYGEDLVGVSLADGRILRFDMDDNPATVNASQITNSPTGCVGVVVTPEEYIIALGADSNPRKIRWPDVDDITDWTPSATNTAEERDLPGTGGIMAGLRSSKETLIWTDTDLFAMRYIGGNFVYNISQVGSKCGPLSRRAMVVVDGQAWWMGRRSFFQYNGFTSPVPSEVGDYVFRDINTVQAAKVWAVANSRFNEVTWFYPSATSDVCNRYVTVNVVTGAWMAGQLNRSAGVDSGAFPTPLWLDEGSQIYRHEVGTSYGNYNPYIASGPVALGGTDNVMHVRELVPDFGTQGGVDVYLYGAMKNDGNEKVYGPLDVSRPIPVRFTARTVRVELIHTTAGWTWGTPALEVKMGGFR